MKVLWMLALIVGFAVFANAQTAILSGIVYDANGAVIVGAKVTAFALIDEKLQKFETATDDNGEYKLSLPYKKYDSSSDFKVSKYFLRAEAKHFELFEIRDFKFVPSYKGQMNLDFALDIQQPLGTIKVDSSKNKTTRKNNK